MAVHSSSFVTAHGTRARTAGLLSFWVALWLIAAPFALQYAISAATWNEVVVGLLIALLALIRLLLPAQTWASHWQGLFGLWLVLSPFFLGYVTSQAYWNQILFGLIILLLGFSHGSSHKHADQN